MSKFGNDIQLRKVMDFGCGPGLTTVLPMEYNQDVELIGLDISSSMVDQANENFKSNDNISFTQIDSWDTYSIDNFFENEKNIKGSVSLITSFSCLHWVADHPKTLKFFHDCLSPNGYIFLLFISNLSAPFQWTFTFETIKKFPKWENYFQTVPWPHLSVS